MTLVSPHQVVIKRALLDGFGRRGVIRTAFALLATMLSGGCLQLYRNDCAAAKSSVAARQMWFKLLCAKDSPIKLKKDFSQHMLGTLRCADLPAPKLRRGRHPQEQVHCSTVRSPVFTTPLLGTLSRGPHFY